MDYKGLKIVEKDYTLLVKNLTDFEPKHVFECGQCFRWKKEKHESYTGVVKDRVINVSKQGNDILLKNTTMDDFESIWFDYFDLGTDYGKIKQILSEDPIMKKAIDFGAGLRLLRQDFTEVLISFIISSNKSIPMIIRVVDAICQSFGEKIYYDQRVFYTFPPITSLADTTVKNLQVCGGGYRCKYIYHTSQMIQKKEVDLSNLGNITLEEARKELNKLHGVGPKISDCVMLFSGLNLSVFPTDIWVKRVMEELYFHKEATLGEIQRLAKAKFGDLKGYAQQYLFYYARENKIGSKKT